MSDGSTLVHVVDDDASIRTAISRLLNAAGYEVRCYASAGEFVIARAQNAGGCVVLDMCMPGPSGLELQESLRRDECAPPVIFLTGYGDVHSSVRAMKAGAVDFLTKPLDREALLGAVRDALERDASTRLQRERLHALRHRYASLTPRERDVAVRVVRGRLNKQIAADLGMAERTVKAHRAKIMEKMQASSVAELVHMTGPFQS
jgi:FixJ family two-component response regulator